MSLTDSPRLWQLVSPALPIGAYSCSHGLEYAAHAKWVDSADSAHQWIDGVARHVIGQLDLPVLARMYDAWFNEDVETVRQWNCRLLAARESAELNAEDRQFGAAMLRLLSALDIDQAGKWDRREPISQACAFALACSTWEIDREETAGGYLWAWCENQVAAAIKLVPLGQTAGQQILFELGKRIPEIVSAALDLGDQSIGASAPGLAIASALHETQYSRLFRS